MSLPTRNLGNFFTFEEVPTLRNAKINLGRAGSPPNLRLIPKRGDVFSGILSLIYSFEAFLVLILKSDLKNQKVRK